jgi:hypothetical protein
MEPEKRKKLILMLIGGLGLYLVSTGLSYAAFRYLSKDRDVVSPLPVKEGREKIDLEAPKTEACPLTGQAFTKAERAIWEKRRPLGVMIENHLESRPQSGLSKADIVYELVAEGGITRFLAIYYCQAAYEDVLLGPVRSARTYFLDLVSEYGDYPLYTHVGGANNFDGSGQTHLKARALEQIGDYGWRLYNDLSGMSLSFPTFWRDYERLPGVATEHTMYSSTDRLWEVAAKRNLTQTNEEGLRWDEDFVSWQFKKEAEEKDQGDVLKIEFNFWDYPDYAVSWEYNQEQKSYLRQNGGQPHKDLNNDQQLKAKTVIVQFMKETGPVDTLKHLLYQTTGVGQALVFQNGEVISANWQKKARSNRTYFKDKQGKEIEFNPGPIWVEILPAGNKVSY